MLSTVVFVSYFGLCIGTFINIRKLDLSIFKKIFTSLFMPLPILASLVAIAVNVIRENQTFKGSHSYPIIVIFSISLYSYAVHAFLKSKTLKEYVAETKKLILLNCQLFLISNKKKLNDKASS